MAETEILKRRESAHQFIEAMPKDQTPVQLYMPNQLKDALFCGHLVTDLDSIAGAIGAADLYGGLPCRASELNTETQFAIDRWGVQVPEKIEIMVDKHPDAGICLVDHQQLSQVNPAIKEHVKRVVGVIDHHALQSETIITEMPIYLDIRPWGSMSTIVAHTYFSMGRRPSKPIAGMLLCAILSDTLNLLGPTTTEWDKMIVALLAEIAEIDDINFLASQQFKAKSKELATLSAHQLVCGDQKAFSLTGADRGYKIGFAVVETTDDEVIMVRKSELLPELRIVKAERKLDLIFLAIVNIVDMRSHLFLAGEAERSLAFAAFEGPISEDGSIMDMGNRVSRKKEFVPPLTSATKNWAMPAPGSVETVAMDTTELYQDPLDPHHKIQRRPSKDLDPDDPSLKGI